MAFYYNNSFYSKNGGGVLHTVYKRFSDIKRHYPEIKYIRTYKIKAQYQKQNNETFSSLPAARPDGLRPYLPPHDSRFLW